MEQGLRGLAAVGVVCSHISLSFFRDLVPPCDNGVDGPSRLFQQPIFRLIVQGNSFVALFFILTGFVNSLKPLKQMQSNDLEGALVALAKSSMNRVPRLVLPAVAVTILTWLATQFGIFEVARRTDAYWLATTSRAPSESWSVAFDDLMTAIKYTWVWGENPYDQPQWALPSLLKASMWIFITLLMTSTTRPSFRIAVFAFAYAWSWVAADAVMGLNVFAGMILAALHSSQMVPELKRRSLRILPMILAIVGLYLMSFPSEYHDWKPWTRGLTRLGTHLFPYYVDFGRQWPAIGGQILCLSALLSPDLRKFLSFRCFTFLGSISFSIYLLHGPLMRSVLVWLSFFPYLLFHTEPLEIPLPLPTSTVLMVVLPIFGSFLIAMSSLWTSKVEPHFGRVTKLIQTIAATSNEKTILLN